MIVEGYNDNSKSNFDCYLIVLIVLKDSILRGTLCHAPCNSVSARTRVEGGGGGAQWLHPGNNIFPDPSYNRVIWKTPKSYHKMIIDRKLVRLSVLRCHRRKFLQPIKYIGNDLFFFCTNSTNLEYFEFRYQKLTDGV